MDGKSPTFKLKSIFLYKTWLSKLFCQKQSSRSVLKKKCFAKSWTQRNTPGTGVSPTHIFSCQFCKVSFQEHLFVIKPQTNVFFLSIPKQENLTQKEKDIPIFCGKSAKGYKEKDVMKNSSEKVVIDNGCYQYYHLFLTIVDWDRRPKVFCERDFLKKCWKFHRERSAMVSLLRI